MKIDDRSASVEIFQKTYVDLGFERNGLFQLIQEIYRPVEVLYPGCSTHITPAFFFPHVVFLDKDPDANRFFANHDQIFREIENRKRYKRSPYFEFIFCDFTKKLPNFYASFDLVLSLFTGSVSRTFGRYLRIDGLLITDNFHEDAVEALQQAELLLIGKIQSMRGKYRIFEAQKLDRKSKGFVPIPGCPRGRSAGSADCHIQDWARPLHGTDLIYGILRPGLPLNLRFPCIWKAGCAPQCPPDGAGLRHEPTERRRTQPGEIWRREYEPAQALKLFRSAPVLKHCANRAVHFDREIGSEFSNIVCLDDIKGAVREFVEFERAATERQVHLIQLFGGEAPVAVLVDDEFRVETRHLRTGRRFSGFPEADQRGGDGVARQLEHRLMDFPVFNDIADVAGTNPKRLGSDNRGLGGDQSIHQRQHEIPFSRLAAGDIQLCGALLRASRLIEVHPALVVGEEEQKIGSSGDKRLVVAGLGKPGFLFLVIHFNDGIEHHRASGRGSQRGVEDGSFFLIAQAEQDHRAGWSGGFR